MSIGQTMKKVEAFHNIAQHTIAEAFENAARAVHIQVIYNRPDAPSLVQEFTWGTDDMLIPALRLIDMVANTRSAFERASSAYGIERALQDMEDVVNAVYQDMDAAKTLPSEFSLEFKTQPYAMQASMINDVPFQRAQKFLHHWHQKLSDDKGHKGGLNYVTITHEHVPNRMSGLAPSAAARLN